MSHEVPVDTHNRLNALGGLGPQPFTQDGLTGALDQPNEHLVLPQAFHVRQKGGPGPEAKPGIICDIREIVEKPEVCRFRRPMPSILARRF